MKKAAVIILNFNGEKDTVSCLQSVAKIDTGGLDVSIIVVDNGSKEGSAQYVQKHAKDIDFGKIHFELLKTGKNLGFAGGNNVGFKHALENGNDYITILNNDTLVDEKFLTELVRVLDSESKIGIVGPKIYFAKGFEYHRDRYSDKEKGKVFWYAGGIMDWDNVVGKHRGVDEVDHGQFDKIEETDFVSGCCMMIKKEALEKVGLFDEKYFLYYEENDLNQRVRKAGYKIIYAPKAVIWHLNARSAGGSGSVLQDYFIARNRMKFGMTYASFRTKLALLRESLRILKSGRQWQKTGIRDYYLQKFGKGSFEV
ncbi:MAG TPA: glycosyltransferase family 2 protein [Candidatus Saccharimonadales bacterium]|nr:glycosyltransferase family 2 protein [Candidatus Saccharimonadales bacterium]